MPVAIMLTKLFIIGLKICFAMFVVNTSLAHAQGGGPTGSEAEFFLTGTITHRADGFSQLAIDPVTNGLSLFRADQPLPIAILRVTPSFEDVLLAPFQPQSQVNQFVQAEILSGSFRFTDQLGATFLDTPVSGQLFGGRADLRNAAFVASHAPSTGSLFEFFPGVDHSVFLRFLFTDIELVGEGTTPFAAQGRFEVGSANAIALPGIRLSMNAVGGGASGGAAVMANGQTAAMSTPEPSSAFLLLVGTIAGIRRRKSSEQKVTDYYLCRIPHVRH
jgi:hypothetical protein